MRNMSFAMTTQQFIDGSKDVTRRFGWWFLKSGDRIRAVEKGMGIPKGGKIRALGVIEVVSVRCEPLYEMAESDCAREGFPHFKQNEFVKMLCDHYRCQPDAIVNRIEFKRVIK